MKNPEGSINFSSGGGHTHDGKNSSFIDTTRYSIFDFPLTKIGSQKRLQNQTRNQNRLDDYIVGVISSRTLQLQSITLPDNTINGSVIYAGTVTAEKMAAEIVLVNNVIKSTNYQEGVDGWLIANTGNAEFNNVTARGTIVANSGTIGGFTITSNTLVGGNGVTQVGVISDSSTSLFAGSDNDQGINANFQVKNTGQVLIGGSTPTVNINPDGSMILDSALKTKSVTLNTGGFVRSSNTISVNTSSGQVVEFFSATANIANNSGSGSSYTATINNTNTVGMEVGTILKANTVGGGGSLGSNAIVSNVISSTSVQITTTTASTNGSIANLGPLLIGWDLNTNGFYAYSGLQSNNNAIPFLQVGTINTPGGNYLPGGNAAAYGVWTSQTVYANDVKSSQGALIITGDTTNTNVNVSANVTVTLSNANATRFFRVDGGTDVSLTAGSGYVIIGSPTSTHITIDNNELQAKTTNGNTAGIMSFNLNGGRCDFGSGGIKNGGTYVTATVNSADYQIWENPNGVNLMQLNSNWGVYGQSLSSARTMAVISSQIIGYLSSTVRTKQDISPYTFNTKAILALEPKRFKYNSTVAGGGDDSDWQYGFIAEEAVAAGLSELCQFDETGQPDYFAYERMCVAQQQVIKILWGKVELLEEKIALLEQA